MAAGMMLSLPPDLLEHFQIIHTRVREIDESKIRVLCVHETPYDSQIQFLKEKKNREIFHQLAFISNWQFQEFRSVLGVPYDSKSVVIESGIDPIDIVKKENDKIRLIYTSTPQRGLGLLVAAFDYLHRNNPKLELDVFSSFKIYGWEDKDKEFEPLYALCREHEAINYHGFAPNQIVREALQKAHIFAYPSIYQETQCRALIEAMSARCLCVHPNFGALWDTSGSNTIMYQGDKDHNRHLEIFVHAMQKAIDLVENRYDEAQYYLDFSKQYVDNRFAEEKIRMQWEQNLRELLQRYPTVESRSIVKIHFLSIREHHEKI